jgi:hypothetical protein
MTRVGSSVEDVSSVSGMQYRRSECFDVEDGSAYSVCILLAVKYEENNRDARQRRVIFSQQRTNHSSIWTMTMLYTPITLVFLDPL